MEEKQEPEKGATILEPIKGVYNGYILDIDVSKVYRVISEREKVSEGEEKYKNFDLIKFMEEAVMSIDLIRKYKPMILYGDADFLHIQISLRNDGQAIEVGNYICSIIENRLEMDSIINKSETPYLENMVNLRAVANSVYYHSKKRYVIRYVWLNGTKVKCIEFNGIQEINLEDLSSHIDWSHRKYLK